MDPTLEAVLIALAKSAPEAIRVIADALAGGESPEKAVARAREAVSRLHHIDTTHEDEARRARVRRR